MNAWLVRAHPHGEDRFSEFLRASIIAMGWPGIGSLEGLDNEDLRKLLGESQYNKSKRELGSARATLNRFVNKMKKGDIILLVRNEEVWLGKVESSYIYSKDHESLGYPHQRKVEWITDTTRDQLSKPLRTSFRSYRSLSKITHHLEEIKVLLSGESYLKKHSEENLMVTYPLRPDYEVTLNIPKDMTKSEAERLGNYLKTLYFDQ